MKPLVLDQARATDRFRMHSLLGVVVLFHPDQGVADRIQTYMPELAKLLVIDNSMPPSLAGIELQQRWPTIELIVNHTNRGIAGALNQAVDYGNLHKYNWLLTMDQDSSFDDGAVKLMKESLLASANDVAILAPEYHAPDKVIATSAAEVTDVRFTMTSGSLMSLKAASHCGPFLEKLFIDSVDHEYCLRLREMGYRIVRINNAILRHQPGTPTLHQFIFWKVLVTHHSSERSYYMTRNRLFIIRHYLTFDPVSCWHEFKQLTKLFMSILLFEGSSVEKLKVAFTGIWHFVIGRYGQYSAGPKRVREE